MILEVKFGGGDVISRACKRAANSSGSKGSNSGSSSQEETKLGAWRGPHPG